MLLPEKHLTEQYLFSKHVPCLPVKILILFVSLDVIQLLSQARLFVTPWTAACQVSLSFTYFQGLLRFMSIESVMLSNHVILCCPLLLLPSVFPSIRNFSNVLALHISWPKYWSFSISPSREYSGLISRFLCNIVLYNIGFCFHHQTHPQLNIISA